MVGVIGYGTAIPRRRIRVQEIARVWGKDGDKIGSGLGIKERQSPHLTKIHALLQWKHRAKPCNQAE